MSAMSDMSRGIRVVTEAYSVNDRLDGIATVDLEDFVQIIGAYYEDLRDELKRRPVEARPA